MKLLKFPYVVQEEVFQNLTNSDLFLLSYVSKNAKKLVKSMPRFKSIGVIQYNCDYSGQVCVSTCPWTNCPWKPEEIVRFVKREDPHNDYLQLNVSGEIINFRFSEQFKPLRVYFRNHERESVIKSIHNYFLGFFGNSMEYQWMANNYSYWSSCRNQPFIPPLQQLTASVDKLIIGCDFTGNLENFLSQCPVWKYISVFTSKRTELFSPESKFYQAEFVNSNQTDHDNPAILRHFQGKQAVIKCIACKIPDLIEFVNRWKSGEAFQKLEYLKIEIRLNEIPLNHFLDVIGTKYLDFTSKPPTHTLPKMQVEDDRKLNTDPITSHAYVVRETDNRVASVMIQAKTMSFGVWDKTEAEFLRIID